MGKKYLPINIRKQMLVGSVRETHVPSIVSEDEWRDIEKQAGAYAHAA